MKFFSIAFAFMLFPSLSFGAIAIPTSADMAEVRNNALKFFGYTDPSTFICTLENGMPILAGTLGGRYRKNFYLISSEKIPTAIRRSMSTGFKNEIDFIYENRLCKFILSEDQKFSDGYLIRRGSLTLADSFKIICYVEPFDE